MKKYQNRIILKMILIFLFITIIYGKNQKEEELDQIDIKDYDGFFEDEPFEVNSNYIIKPTKDKPPIFDNNLPDEDEDDVAVIPEIYLKYNLKFK
jgi:hypothetical protein